MRRFHIISIVIVVILVAVLGYLGTHKSYSQGEPFSISKYHQNINDLGDIVKEQNPRAALKELASRMKTDKFVFKNCHFMAHEIGRLSYDKYGDFDTALQYQDTTCSDGYLHGVIEEKFVKFPHNNHEIITAVQSICNRYTYPDRCWHGVGHGLMFFTSNDLPAALQICDTYPLLKARYRCYEGVFMENFLSDPNNHPSAYLDPDDPFTPCPDEPSKFKPTCYFYVPIYYLKLNHDDYASAINWCQSAEIGYESACVRGVGSLAMKYNIDNPKYVEKICMKAPSNQISACISGMVSYHKTFFGITPKTPSLCNVLDPAHVNACRSASKRMIID